MGTAHMPAFVSLNNTPTLIQRVDEDEQTVISCRHNNAGLTLASVEICGDEKKLFVESYAMLDWMTKGLGDKYTNRDAQLCFVIWKLEELANHDTGGMTQDLRLKLDKLNRKGAK